MIECVRSLGTYACCRASFLLDQGTDMALITGEVHVRSVRRLAEACAVEMHVGANRLLISRLPPWNLTSMKKRRPYPSIRIRVDLGARGDIVKDAGFRKSSDFLTFSR
jgi:hypothetical protein